MKRCKKCGAPLEGFLYNTIGKFMGIKPSEKDPELCNKCEEETPKEDTQAEAQTISESAPIASSMPESSADEIAPETEKAGEPTDSPAEQNTEKVE